MKLPKVPNTLSREYCESIGWTVADCERQVPYSHIRQDLFGCFDLVALLKGTNGVIGIQTTGERDNAIKRMRKIGHTTAAFLWLECGNTLFVHAWAWRGGKAKRTLTLWEWQGDLDAEGILWRECGKTSFTVKTGKVLWSKANV